MDVDDPAAVAGPAAPSFATFRARLKSREGVEFDCPDSRLEGFNDLTLDQKHSIVDAISYILTLAAVLQWIVSTEPHEAYEPFVETARTFLPNKTQHHLQSSSTQSNPQPQIVEPFQPLSRRVNNSEQEYVDIVSSDNARTCTCPWGPPATAKPVRDLLSVSAMMLYVWLGRDTAQPLLDLTFAFCETPTDFARAWVLCPVEHGASSRSKLDIRGLHSSAARHKSRGVFATPAQLIASFARDIVAILEPLSEGIFLAHSFFPAHFNPASLVNLVVRPVPGQVAAAPAHQYDGMVKQKQVLSPLPTASSLPSYTPNFVDETNAQWFRTAQYHFSEMKFPQAALELGDASAECHWHQYVCEVLHARTLCLNLSESQVIRHLSMSFPRTAMHYQTAIEKAQTPHCTVTDWLDAIRDVFFTNGLFRQHIEQAWQTYKAGMAADFNDLVHHIRTYYQLIFLDYPTLPGDMSMHDFAWHLFEKMQYLMSSACKTSLGLTLRMYIPHSDLLKQMHQHLSHAQGWSTAKADQAGTRFIVWCIEQLHVAKASANAAQRYSTVSYLPTAGVDYAALSHRPVQHSLPPFKRPKLGGPRPEPLSPRSPENPRRTGIALTNSVLQPPPGSVYRAPYRDRRPPPPTNRRVMQTSSRSPGNPSGPRQSPHPPADTPFTSFPNPPTGKGSRQRLREWLEMAYQHHSVPQWLRALYYFERDHEGQSNTLHYLARQMDLPYGVPSTVNGQGMCLLKSHFLHPVQMCAVCPSSTPASQRRHPARECPEVLRQLAARGLSINDVAPGLDPGKCFFAHDPATSLEDSHAAAAPSRKRCDSRDRSYSHSPRHRDRASTPDTPHRRARSAPSNRSDARTPRASNIR